MSYNHRTEGLEKWEGVMLGLSLAGVVIQDMSATGTYEKNSYEDGKFRILKYIDPQTGKVMVVEEYLAIKDCDCDSTSRLGVVVYEEGDRPILKTEIIEA